MSDVNPYASPQAKTLAADRPPRPIGTVDVWTVARRWILLATVLAFFSGIGSRMARPFFPGSIHYETIAALVVLSIMCLSLLLRFWRFPLMQGLISLNVGVLCSWTTFTIGWSVVHGAVWEDLVDLSLVSWACSAAVGSITLLLPHRRYIKKGAQLGDLPQ